MSAWPTPGAAKLFGLIQPALRELAKAEPNLSWSLGDGTALAVWLGHRISQDIDLFFDASRALRLLSPNQNPLIKAITPHWQEPGHYLKLEVQGLGEIDILVTRDWTTPPTARLQIGGDTLDVQHPAEIMARKIAYRSPDFKSRDFFDLAATGLLAHGELIKLRPILQSRRAVLQARWLAMKSSIQQQIAADVIPTQLGTALIPRLPRILDRLLDIAVP